MNLSSQLFNLVHQNTQWEVDSMIWSKNGHDQSQDLDSTIQYKLSKTIATFQYQNFKVHLQFHSPKIKELHNMNKNYDLLRFQDLDNVRIYLWKINSIICKLRLNFIIMAEERSVIVKEKAFLTKVLHLDLVRINHFPSFFIENFR